MHAHPAAQRVLQPTHGHDLRLGPVLLCELGVQAGHNPVGPPACVLHAQPHGVLCVRAPRPQIAMTFNVGLFCSVVLGYVLGAFLFASFPENYAMYLQVRPQ